MATVSTSSSQPSVATVVAFAIQPTRALAQNDVIVISGLTGSLTADNAALPLTGGAFGATGGWQQGTGTLTLTVGVAGVGTGGPTTFSVSLVNPASGAGVTPSIRTTATSSVLILAAPALCTYAATSDGPIFASELPVLACVLFCWCALASTFADPRTNRLLVGSQFGTSFRHRSRIPRRCPARRTPSR